MKNMKQFLAFIGMFGMSLRLSSLPFITWDWLLLFATANLKIKKNDFYFIFSSLSLFCIVGVLALGNYEELEYLKSLGNFIFFALAFLSVRHIRTTTNIENPLRILSLVLFVFMSLQAFSYFYTGSTFLYFILDNISISTAEDIGRFEAVNLLGYMRPFGMYHEPSFAALIAIILIVHRYEEERIIDYFSIGSIILSISVTGYLSLLIFLMINFRLARYILLPLAAINLVVLIEFLRLPEIFVPGTSGHERIGVLFLEFQNLFGRYFIPIPLGNFEKQPNNSLQVIIGYYSIFSPIAVSYMIYLSGFRRLPALFSLLFTNGAIFTVSGGVLLALTEKGRRHRF